jgi:zinc transport system permease protein
MLGIFLAEGHWLDALLDRAAALAPEGSPFANEFNLRALLALVLVSLCCGAVGSVVVGGRMAFFSDALAHTAFAGVSIGFVLYTALLAQFRPKEEFWDWVTPLMLAFGVLVGYLIAVLTEKTGLASDTIIGVVFAAAIGLAAALRKLMSDRSLFTLEDFLFGDPVLVRPSDIVQLAVLVVVVFALVAMIHNPLFMSSINPSLAQSRQVPQRLVRYLFVMLLALVVNLCVRTVGVLLINALLVVPAATAANLGRNLRQVFWLTLLLSLAASLAGLGIAWEVEARTWSPETGRGLAIGIPGAVILFSVLLFVLSAVLGPWLRERPAAPEPSPAPPA